MITPSMTFKEVYDHLADDLKKVEYRKDYYLPKAIKEFRKAKQFPVWKWYEYEVPQTKNKYVIYYYAENWESIENPKIGFFANVFFDRKRCVIKLSVTGYKHTPESPIMLLRQIQVYSSHFLQRYNERCLKDKTLGSNDLACRYLARNDIAMPIEISEDINRNIEQYGEGGKEGFIVEDGLCFAQTRLDVISSEDGDRNNDKVNALAIVFTTFIPRYMMTQGQLFAIEKEHWEKWSQAYMNFMKEAPDGTLTLKLEP